MFHFKIKPKLNYNNYFENAKFNFTWYGMLAFFVMTVILTGVHSTQGGTNLYIISQGLFISIFSLAYMMIFKQYKLVAFVVIFIGSFVTQYMIYIQLNPNNVIDFIWVMNLSLYAFYVLNNKFGILTLIINSLGFGLKFFILGRNVVFKHLFDYTIQDQIDYYLHLIFGVFMIILLFVKIKEENLFAQKKLTQSNEDLIEKNKLVEAQNEEKTIMLKEIHHRVKNNLQIVTSLLRLQAAELQDDYSKTHFDDAVNRIIAMSLIHEKMYKSKDLSKIDLNSYVKTLTEDLIHSYSIGIPVNVDVDSNLETIQPKSLVNVALLLNELITNSLKHGFKTNKEGQIKVSIKNEPTMTSLKYFDNGIWVGNEKSSGFGMDLVESTTEQLDGEFVREIKNGTKYEFTFPTNL